MGQSALQAAWAQVSLADSEAQPGEPFVPKLKPYFLLSASLVTRLLFLMSLLPVCVCLFTSSKSGKEVMCWPLVTNSLLNLHPRDTDVLTGLHLPRDKSGPPGACLSSLPPSLEGNSAAHLVKTLEFSLSLPSPQPHPSPFLLL